MSDRIALLSQRSRGLNLNNVPAPIAHVLVEAVQVPIHMPFAIAKETLDQASLAIVSLTDAQGRIGLGEASPFPSLTGDSIETAGPAARDLAQATHGLTPLQALEALRTRRSDIFSKTPTAYVAVETALIDLHAKQLGVPLARLFGLGFALEARTDITLPLMTASEVLRFWSLFESYSFKQIKVKVSGRVSEDIEMIQALIRISSPGTELTLDGNQGFTPAKALQIIDILLKQGIKPLFFEQPLPEDDWEGLKMLSAQSPIPICLDETVKTAADAIRVVNDKTARMINLKIMKSGLEETLRIVAVARSGGLELMIGGMLESEIAMSASLQILAGTGAISHVDLDTPFFMTKRLTKTSPWHANSALLRLPHGPGLNLELAMDPLQRKAL